MSTLYVAETTWENLQIPIHWRFCNKLVFDHLELDFFGDYELAIKVKDLKNDQLYNGAMSGLPSQHLHV